jgi:DNA-binding NarL/FixJ family response regulator
MAGWQACDWRGCGFDLIERLRILSPELFRVAFIFLTALADRDNHLRGRRLGADDYITKPVDYEILREVIRVRLGGRDPGQRPKPLPPDDVEHLAAWFRPGGGDVPNSLLTGLVGQFRRSPPPALPPVAGFADVGPAPRDKFGASLGDLPMGVVILDRSGTVHYVNESAARVLGGGRVALLGRRACPPLAALVLRHIKARAANRIAIGDGAAPVTAIARTAGSDAYGKFTERVTVLLPALPVAPRMMAVVLHSLFNLTPAEQLLATELGTGANLSDVARARGVAMGTVRTQLKSVFGKMGVTRQSELVRALMSLQLATGFAEP